MQYTFTTLLSIYINKLTYYIEGELPVVKCIFKSRPLTFKRLKTWTSVMLELAY